LNIISSVTFSVNIYNMHIQSVARPDSEAWTKSLQSAQNDACYVINFFYYFIIYTWISFLKLMAPGSRYLSNIFKLVKCFCWHFCCCWWL